MRFLKLFSKKGSFLKEYFLNNVDIKPSSHERIILLGKFIVRGRVRRVRGVEGVRRVRGVEGVRRVRGVEGVRRVRWVERFGRGEWRVKRL